jgi:hypothetical protein
MRLDRPEPAASNQNSVTDVRKTFYMYAKPAGRARAVSKTTATGCLRFRLATAGAIHSCPFARSGIPFFIEHWGVRRDMHSHTAIKGIIIWTFLAAAPLNAELVVSPPPTPPPARNIARANSFPPLLPLRRRVKMRCEQDRLLTDASPCGKETEEPVLLTPRKKIRCEQDRLLTDTTSCDR